MTKTRKKAPKQPKLRIEEYVEKEDSLTDDEKNLRSSQEFQDKKAAALAIIQHMQNSPIPFKDIVERLDHIGLKIGDIMRIVEQLKREGEIFEPLRDHIQVI
jgi:flagellar basal body P-ring protein FlgI